jgi:putative RecB family exonuclease
MSAAAIDQPVSQPAGPRTVDELLVTVSASRLTTWLQCRLKFWFRYLSGIVKPKPAALHVGGSVHEVLKYWNRARWHHEHPSLKDFHDAYSASWQSLQQKEPVQFADQESEKQTGWKLIETYMRESPITPDEKPEAVEVSVEADLTKHGLPKLVGIIDLVRPLGRIVDFKTSGKTPDAEMVRHTTEAQLTSYGVLYRQATARKESAVELHHLVKTKNPKLVVTEAPAASDLQVTRLFRWMESYIKGLQSRDFVPAPGIQCASCEFFNECRAHNN